MEFTKTNLEEVKTNLEELEKVASTKSIPFDLKLLSDENQIVTSVEQSMILINDLRIKEKFKDDIKFVKDFAYISTHDSWIPKYYKMTMLPYKKVGFCQYEAFSIQNMLDMLPKTFPVRSDDLCKEEHHLDIIVETYEDDNKKKYAISLRRSPGDCLVGTHIHETLFDAVFDIFVYYLKRKAYKDEKTTRMERKQ